jgi:hypothetical protein
MNKNFIGGDGFSIDVNNSIGGLPSFIRYSNNYKPIFDGDLLKGGGCSCLKSLIKKENNKDQQGGACSCARAQQGGACSCARAQQGGAYIDEEKYIIDIILQKGGAKNSITQFSAIKEVSNKLKTLEKKSLSKLSLDVIINELTTKNPKKSQTFYKNMKYLQKKLLSFDKHNLTVLSSLLLLHHCATNSEKIDNQQGGDSGITSSLSSILAPLGVNAFGASVFLVFLQKSFTEAMKKKSEKNDSDGKGIRRVRKQSGGNSLKNLIAPLGTSAFVATAILVLLERLFTDVINEKKSKNADKKKMYGGRVTKKSEKLINVLSPISFNAFAKESFLKNLSNNSNNSI